MKRTSTIGYLAATILFGGTTFSQAVMADGLDGVYLGGHFGWSRSSYETGFINDQLQSLASAGDLLQFGSSSADRSSRVWWANSGYWFGEHFGFDAAFLHLGELTYRVAETLKTSTGDEPIATAATVSSRGPAISLLGRLPLTDALEIDMRLGDYDGKSTRTTRLEFNSIFGTSTQSTSKSSLLIGAGGGYTFAEHWTVRLDFIRINQAGDTSVGKFNVDLASAGVTFTF
jgi:hypothetical protein